MEQTKIMICPSCGADCGEISPANITDNKCPFCGSELYDHSREIYDEKIEDVVRKKKKMMSVPRRIAIIVCSTFFVVIVLAAVFFGLGLDDKFAYGIALAPGKRMTSKMEKAYEKKDYDELYNLVIENADKSISSSYYFTYRTAWYLNTFPTLFDEATDNDDTDKMKEYYKYIKDDYNRRDDSFYRLYDSVEEIESQLVEEYQRESEIMANHGLE